MSRSVEIYLPDGKAQAYTVGNHGPNEQLVKSIQNQAVPQTVMIVYADDSMDFYVGLPYAIFS